MNERIQPHHLSRKAFLYVRQSSVYQVQNYTESKQLQYAMRNRLEELGWSEIEIIDEDLGQTASGVVQRVGFEKMLSEVCLGKVGAVAAREVSRFARNSKDWQQLIEICRLVDTLLIDHDAVYDSRKSNDRLLLGLKGTMNEYELELLRVRSLEARMAKAKRGELYHNIPIGFVLNEARIEKTPDMRVQQVIELIFKKFFELGSARQVSCWLAENNVDMPSLVKVGKNGQVQWKRSRYTAVTSILQNPLYAGIYAYGRTQTKQKLVNGNVRKTSLRVKKEDYHVFIPDHHEGYIDKTEYYRIDKMLTDNVQGSASKGAVKRGPSLLAGLLRCKRCGRKLLVAYTGNSKNSLRYICHRGHLSWSEPKCIGFGGPNLDKAVSEEILRVLEAQAIDATREAWEQIRHGKDDRIDSLKLQIESAVYESQRAFRQYDASDPENRLVTAELEKRWNACLDRQASLEKQLKELESGCKTEFLDWDDFYKLYGDLEKVWNCPECDAKIKKRIIRTLIQEIVVDVNREAGLIIAVIHWFGGIHSELKVKTRRTGQTRYSTSDSVRQAIRELALVCDDEIIASTLNQNKILTGHGNRWSQIRVGSFRSKHKIKRKISDNKKQAPWMNLTQASEYLGVSGIALRKAAERGEIQHKRPLPKGPWIFKTEDLRTEQALLVAERIKARYRGGKLHDSKTLTLFKSST